MSEKKNFWAQEIGAQNGVIKFGSLSPDGDVTASWSVTGCDGRHFITLDEDGQRTGWTTMNAPGVIQIQSGEDLLTIDESASGGRKNKCAETAIIMNAENGDIVIRARNGKLRFEGLDIEFVAKGGANEGKFKVKAYEDLKLDSKNITIDGTTSISLVSTGIIHMRSPLTNIVSGLVWGVTAATLTGVIPKSLSAVSKFFKK